MYILFFTGLRRKPHGAAFLLHFTSSLERLYERYLIGVLKVGAYRDAVGYTRYAHVERRKQLGDIYGGRRALYGRIRRHDDLLDLAAGKTQEQLVYLYIVGRYSIHRRKCAMQDVINAVKFVCRFESVYVLGAFDNAYYRFVALGRGAYLAGVGVGEVLAYAAEFGLLLCLGYGICHCEGLIGAHALKDIKGYPLGAFASDSRQLLKALYQ